MTPERARRQTRAMSGTIVVVNGGSSSIKAAAVVPETGDVVAAAVVERIGGDAPTLRFGAEAPTPLPTASDHAEALRVALPRLLHELGAEASPMGVGHRVVHGGERFTEPTLIDDEVVAAIEALTPLAPLHNPANVAGIRAARRVLPQLPHVAVFDTAFHATIPPAARHYAIDHELAQTHGIRRYGFHGTSHRYVADRAAEHLETPLSSLRLITCHLGNGASVTAIDRGRSVETSMGMTPVEGLVMGTRTGDIDAGALLYLARVEGFDAVGLDGLINQRSGLLGLSGVSKDVRDIEARADGGDARCRLALEVFAHRVRKYIGAYVAVLGSCDALVFTAGIGENSASMRARIAGELQGLGVTFDQARNAAAAVGRDTPVASVAAPDSAVQVLVVATDEQREIALETATLIRG